MLDCEWDRAGLESDSAVRVSGVGFYVWTFKGRIMSQPQASHRQPQTFSIGASMRILVEMLTFILNFRKP